MLDYYLHLNKYNLIFEIYAWVPITLMVFVLLLLRVPFVYALALSKPLNKMKIYIITRLIIYKWLPLVIMVFLLVFIRSIPVVYADEHWDAFAREKWGTTNPTLEEMYPIKTPQSQMQTFYDEKGKHPDTTLLLKSKIHNQITALCCSSAQRNHIGLPTLNTLSLIDSPLPFVSTIFHNYNELLFNTFQNDRQMLAETLRFLKDTIPQEMWATSPNQLRDPNCHINRFQENLNHPDIIHSDNQKVALLYLRLSISIYNAFLLNNRDIITDFDTAYKVFMIQLEKQRQLTL